jgi:hypothetical protein
MRSTALRVPEPGSRSSQGFLRQPGQGYVLFMGQGVVRRGQNDQGVIHERNGGDRQALRRLSQNVEILQPGRQGLQHLLPVGDAQGDLHAGM